MSTLRRLVLVIAATMAAAAVGFGDQRLSEVAGAITLKRPAGEQLVIVEPADRTPGSRMETTGADLTKLADQLLESGRAASAVLDESRSGLTFFEGGWRRRMLDALAEIDTTRFSLELVETPERYRDALARVTDGAREYQLAAGIVRWAILRDQPVFSRAFDHMRVGEREVGAALGGLRRVGAVEGSEGTPPSIDPFTASQAMAEACRGYLGAAQGADYDRCIDRQRAAVAAIGHRFSFTERVEEPAFNAIRNRCREEWPRDFISRDRCERQAIGELTGG
jgi:hypothetical protein